MSSARTGFTQEQLESFKQTVGDWKFIPSASDTGEGFPNRIAVGDFAPVIYISEKRVGELLAEARRDEREKFAAFVGPDREPRKVVGNIPILASGEFVGNHATVWAANAGEVFSLRIDNIGATDSEDSDAFFEAGELFSTKQAADAAKEKK